MFPLSTSKEICPTKERKKGVPVIGRDQRTILRKAGVCTVDLTTISRILRMQGSYNVKLDCMLEVVKHFKAKSHDH
jgi:hypothetical protein